MLTEARPDRNEETKGSFKGNPSGRVVNWISSQSVPEPLPPFSGGASRSGLLELLRKEHKSVKLSQQELAEIACWIDLLVPYGGDYLEANAWTEDELKKYERDVQDTTKGFEAKIDEAVAHKEKEVMEV